jgi:hypothetical protein
MAGSGQRHMNFEREHQGIQAAVANYLDHRGLVAGVVRDGLRTDAVATRSSHRRRHDFPERRPPAREAIADQLFVPISDTRRHSRASSCA